MEHLEIQWPFTIEICFGHKPWQGRCDPSWGNLGTNVACQTVSMLIIVPMISVSIMSTRYQIEQNCLGSRPKILTGLKTHPFPYNFIYWFKCVYIWRSVQITGWGLRLEWKKYYKKTAPPWSVQTLNIKQSMFNKSCQPFSSLC